MKGPLDRFPSPPAESHVRKAETPQHLLDLRDLAAEWTSDQVIDEIRSFLSEVRGIRMAEVTIKLPSDDATMKDPLQSRVAGLLEELSGGIPQVHEEVSHSTVDENPSDEEDFPVLLFEFTPGEDSHSITFSVTLEPLQHSWRGSTAV